MKVSHGKVSKTSFAQESQGGQTINDLGKKNDHFSLQLFEIASIKLFGKLVHKLAPSVNFIVS